jgi:hypothetical protein
MLVVGARGLGTWIRLLMGSVSTEVVHDANVPVVVIPGDHQATGALGGSHHECHGSVRPFHGRNPVPSRVDAPGPQRGPRECTGAPMELSGEVEDEPRGYASGEHFVEAFVDVVESAGFGDDTGASQCV